MGMHAGCIGGFASVSSYVVSMPSAVWSRMA
jgi:hypothetical protein